MVCFEALMSSNLDAPVSLADLLGRPLWQRDAACQEHPEATFFPDKGESTTAAKLVCSGCLCRVECLDFALAEGIEHGVWGGESPAGRQALRAA